MPHGKTQGTLLARNKPSMDVVLLMRDRSIAADINGPLRCNTRYLKSYPLPPNLRASTTVPEALAGAQYVVHAVPVQHSAAFLTQVAPYMPPGAPVLSVSKGLEVGTCQVCERRAGTGTERDRTGQDGMRAGEGEGEEEGALPSG